ncbi:recombinase family protein [Chloroflexota bacterium]
MKAQQNMVLLLAISMLCRQGIGPVLQLISTFETYCCHVISIQESWTQDTGPMRELFIAMAAWAGKFESDRRSERTKAGLERARANGKVLGRPVGKKDGKKRIKKRPVVYRHERPSVNAVVQ